MPPTFARVRRVAMTNQVQALGAIHHARTHPTSDTCGQLAYCGFYDRANIGDYALFKANELLFPAAFTCPIWEKLLPSPDLSITK